MYVERKYKTNFIVLRPIDSFMKSIYVP